MWCRPPRCSWPSPCSTCRTTSPSSWWRCRASSPSPSRPTPWAGVAPALPGGPAAGDRRHPLPVRGRVLDPGRQHPVDHGGGVRLLDLPHLRRALPGGAAAGHPHQPRPRPRGAAVRPHDPVPPDTGDLRGDRHGRDRVRAPRRPHALVGRLGGGPLDRRGGGGRGAAGAVEAARLVPPRGHRGGAGDAVGLRPPRPALGRGGAAHRVPLRRLLVHPLLPEQPVPQRHGLGEVHQLRPVPVAPAGAVRHGQPQHVVRPRRGRDGAVAGAPRAHRLVPDPHPRGLRLGLRVPAPVPPVERPPPALLLPVHLPAGRPRRRPGAAGPGPGGGRPAAPAPGAVGGGPDRHGRGGHRGPRSMLGSLQALPGRPAGAVHQGRRPRPRPTSGWASSSRTQTTPRAGPPTTSPASRTPSGPSPSTAPSST